MHVCTFDLLMYRVLYALAGRANSLLKWNVLQYLLLYCYLRTSAFKPTSAVMPVWALQAEFYVHVEFF
jgi:hypothetical protein